MPTGRACLPTQLIDMRRYTQRSGNQHTAQLTFVKSEVKRYTNPVGKVLYKKLAWDDSEHLNHPYFN